MTTLPPNDPNRNNNNNNARRAKDQPYDGRRRGDGSQNGQPMDIMGNMEDQPAVVMMFLVGVAAWFLRERCVC